MTKTISKERKNATVDSMTDLLNRRAYEDEIAKLGQGPLAENFVYASLDLNGLKTANDSLGHDAGDKLLHGCSQCVKQCFGNYGDLFRIGGDEFAGLLFIDESGLCSIKQEFEELQEDWSKKNNLQLSVSMGTASAHDYPDATVAELAKMADEKMYEAKREHYAKCPEADRRAHKRA